MDKALSIALRVGKWILYAPVVVIVAILVLVVIIFIVLVIVPITGAISLWAWNMRKLRRDPRIDDVEFKNYIDLDFDGQFGEYEEFVFAKRYFKALTTKMADTAKAKAGKITTKTEKVENNNNMKNIMTMERKLSSGYTSLSFEMALAEWENDAYERGYFTVIEGYDDAELVDAIYVDIEHLGKKSRLQVGNNPLAAIFCQEILRGHGWYNRDTGQLWAELPEHKAWLVRYKPDKADFGLRREKTLKRARKYWF